MTGHLLGQHPDRFRSGSMRNPALGLDRLSLLSDIPDWPYVNCYGWQVGRRQSLCLKLPLVQDGSKFEKHQTFRAAACLPPPWHCAGPLQSDATAMQPWLCLCGHGRLSACQRAGG